MSGHMLIVPTRVVRVEPDGEPRWCFVCRERVAFTFTVHTPTDPMSYYGPHGTVECVNGHTDGDCFPGTWREYAEPGDTA